MPALRVLIATLTLLVVSALAAPTALARQEEEPEPRIDPEALQTFVDRFFTAAVVEEPVPGAAVVAVQGRRAVLLSGYGVAEVDTSREVDPRTTVFRAAALSPLVTAVSALQLVETEQLDLTSDVNRWLAGVTVPDTHPEPVTLASLLTSTSGIDDAPAATDAPSAAEVLPLEDYLQRTPLQRSEPPDQVVRRSDLATALAGLLVEQRSHQRFPNYTESNVFGRLRMRFSGFVADPEADAAVGYRVVDRRLERAPEAHPHTVPARSLQTTAYDMGGLTAALIGDGAVSQRRRILAPESARLLRTRQFRSHRELPGVSFGLAEHVENGQTAWLAGGSELGSTSLLLLLPAHDFGLFLAYNSEHEPVRDRFVRAFFDEFFPEAGTRGDDPDGDGADLAGYVGSYAPQRPRSTFLAFAASLRDEVEVSAAGDVLAYRGREWQQIGPDLFQAREDPDLHLGFRRDEGGQVVDLVPEQQVGGEASTLSRQPWHRTRAGAQWLAGGFAAAFVLVLLVAAWHRRRARRRHAGLRSLARVVAGANLLFLVALPLAVLLAGRDLRFSYGIPPAFPVLLSIPLATLVVSLVLAVVAVVAAVRGRLAPAALLWPLSVTALGVAFALLAAAWDALGPFGLGPYL